ncbi:MAG: hypothetical protein H6779_03945 [Candidatus Nomurabacteria bacterium]|nr:MAG: hypothetical protein H6779_03945 [Candidatus Nomurabacteria bacterium]
MSISTEYSKIYGEIIKNLLDAAFVRYWGSLLVIVISDDGNLYFKDKRITNINYFSNVPAQVAISDVWAVIFMPAILNLENDVNYPNVINALIDGGEKHLPLECQDEWHKLIKLTQSAKEVRAD